jgi:hypothetical protein
MRNKHEPKWNIEDLSEAEIYAAIRYLDEHDETSANEQNDNTAFVVCAILGILLLVFLFLWLR